MGVKYICKISYFLGSCSITFLCCGSEIFCLWFVSSGVNIFTIPLKLHDGRRGSWNYFCRVEFRFLWLSWDSHKNKISNSSMIHRTLISGWSRRKKHICLQFLVKSTTRPVETWWATPSVIVVMYVGKIGVNVSLHTFNVPDALAMWACNCNIIASWMVTTCTIHGPSCMFSGIRIFRWWALTGGIFFWFTILFNLFKWIMDYNGVLWLFCHLW